MPPEHGTELIFMQGCETVPSLRAYRDSDRERVEYICRSTAGKRAMEDKVWGEVILELYCRYYITKSKDYCFVGTDENGVATGYIFCAPSQKEYIRGYLRDEVRAVGKLGLQYRIIALGEMIAREPFSKKYPAHMHIDLCEGCRRQGLGSALVKELCEKLRAEGVPGLMLIVGKGNKNAVAFYKRNGFHIFMSVPGGYMMGKKL